VGSGECCERHLFVGGHVGDADAVALAVLELALVALSVGAMKDAASRSLVVLELACRSPPAA
jgi:hypothetical protein